MRERISQITRHQYLFHFIYLFALIITLFPEMAAQDESVSSVEKPERKNIFSIEGGFNYGFIYAHSNNVAVAKGSNPLGAELSLGWMKNDTSTREICNCYPRQGMVFSYYNFGEPILGRMLGASYFIEPQFRIGKKNYFFIKGLLGGALADNPYDSIHNPENKAYSTTFNFFMTLGLGVSLWLNDHWWLKGSFNFQHISNAAFRKPNAGLNWPTAGILIGHQNKPMPVANGTRHKEKFWKNNPVRWDLYVFGIASKTTSLDQKEKFYPIIGTGISGSKQVGTINAINFGTEIFTDKAHQAVMEKDSQFVSSIRAGLLAGHEFLLGKFIFSQRLGYYYFNKTNYQDFFHRWGLQFRFSRHWSTGFSLLAHGKTADFVDLRLIYSF